MMSHTAVGISNTHTLKRKKLYPNNSVGIGGGGTMISLVRRNFYSFVECVSHISLLQLLTLQSQSMKREHSL